MSNLTKFITHRLAVGLLLALAVGQLAVACENVITFAPRSCTARGCSDSYYPEGCGIGLASGGYACYAQGCGLCCSTSYTAYSVTGTGQCVQDGGNGNPPAPTFAMLTETVFRARPRACGGGMVESIWRAAVPTKPTE